jgi:peroxiredoxin
MKLRGTVLLLLVASLVSGCSESGPAESGGEIAAAEAAQEARREAPDFTLEMLGGGTVRLADLRGKTVVIDFWATWCPPCEFQVPELNAFYEAHKGDTDVAVLGISVDIDAAEAVRNWIDEKQVKYPVLLDGEELARRYGALGFPTLYIVAPDGSVDSEHVGLIETGDLEAALARQRASGAG